MRKIIHLEYCGMDGSGPTVKEAKQDATRKIEALLKETWKPIYIVCRNVSGVLWRDPHGWHFNYLFYGYGELPEADNVFQSYSSGNRDRDEAHASALESVAQSAWNG